MKQQNETSHGWSLSILKIHGIIMYYLILKSSSFFDYSWEAFPNVKTSLSWLTLPLNPRNHQKSPWTSHLSAPIKRLWRCRGRFFGLLFWGGLWDGNGVKTTLFMLRMLKDHCENRLNMKKEHQSHPFWCFLGVPLHSFNDFQCISTDCPSSKFLDF